MFQYAYYLCFHITRLMKVGHLTSGNYIWHICILEICWVLLVLWSCNENFLKVVRRPGKPP